MKGYTKFYTRPITINSIKNYINEAYIGKVQNSVRFHLFSSSRMANGYTIKTRLFKTKRYDIYINIKKVLCQRTSDIMKWFYLECIIEHELYHIRIDNNDNCLEGGRELFFVLGERNVNWYEKILDRMNQYKMNDSTISFEEEFCIFFSIRDALNRFNQLLHEEEKANVVEYLNIKKLFLDNIMISYNYLNCAKSLYKSCVINLSNCKKRIKGLVQEYPDLRLVFDNNYELNSLDIIWLKQKEIQSVEYFNYILIQSVICLRQDYDTMFLEHTDLKCYIENLIIEYCTSAIEYIKNKELLTRIYPKKVINDNEMMIVKNIDTLKKFAKENNLNVVFPNIKFLC